MANVLPYIPSFGEKLVPTVAGALGNIAKGYGQRRTNLHDDQILQGLAQNKDASPIDQIKAFGSLSSERQKSLTPIFTQYIKSQQKQQENATKKAEQEDEHQKKLKNTNEILNDLEKEKSYVGGQFGTKTFGGKLRRETIQKRRAIDSEAIALEGYFRDLATKGTLPKAVFNELLNRIPNSEMSEREYQGSIDGIRKILKANGLSIDETSEPENETSIQKERPPLESFYQ